MRMARLAVVAVAAAVLGGAAALALGKAGGWLGSTTTTSYVVTEQSGAAPAAVRTVAGPLVSGAFDPAHIYAARAAGVVTVFSFFGRPSAPLVPESQGSGFVVSRDGLILTNSHVITTAGDSADGPVHPAKAVYVEFQDGDRLAAQVVGWDVFDDVGVLRVDPRQHGLVPLPLGRSSDVVIGEPVAAIGSPFGNRDSLSVGVVSATRSISSLTSRYELVDAIQTDAPINHGNSGGPLLDASGKVIGINAQIRDGGQGSSGFEGVGFAVPIDSARRSLGQLLADGHVAYAYAGISTEDLTPSLARHFGLPVLRGAIVASVEGGSGAARAGLRAGTDRTVFAGQQVRMGGDVIVAIDGLPVRNGDDVVRIVADTLRPGETARFAIVRGGRRLVVPIRLDTRPAR